MVCSARMIKYIYKSPRQNILVSPTTDPERRKKWLQLARRDPSSVLSHTNIFMREDHFDMEKDTTIYMKYIMGFTQKIFLTDDAVPHKFHCQKDRKRRLSPQAGPSREAYLKRQRTSLVMECLESQSTIETHPESVEQNKNIIVQETVMMEELPKFCDKETFTEINITAEKSIQVKTKVTKHFRSKAVQATSQNKSICTSPLKVCTSSFTSPFKIKPCRLQPSQSGVVRTARRKLIQEDERSDSETSSRFRT